MPTLINAVDVRPRVYYRTIQIGPILFDQAPAEDDTVQIPGEGWSLTSSDNDFYPLVRLEVWDGPTSQASGSWEYDRTFQSRMADRLMVVDLNGVCYGEIALQPGPYDLRLLCRGRDHVEASLALDPFPPEGPHEDPLRCGLSRCTPPADTALTDRAGNDQLLGLPGHPVLLAVTDDTIGRWRQDNLGLQVAVYAALLPLRMLTYRHIEALGRRWGRKLARRSRPLTSAGQGDDSG